MSDHGDLERLLAERGPWTVAYGDGPSDLVQDAVYLAVPPGIRSNERLERGGAAVPESVEEVEGRTDSLPKVQAGGWSQARYQRHSEEIWRDNQDDVAETVERLVRENQPRFVVVSGDIRARQLLLEKVNAETRGLVVEVDAHTRAAASSDAAVDEAVADALDRELRDDEAQALDQAAAAAHRLAAHGVREITPLLQRAQVDTLILDDDIVDSERTLEALDDSPWWPRATTTSTPRGVSVGCRQVTRSRAPRS